MSGSADPIEARGVFPAPARWILAAVCLLATAACAARQPVSTAPSPEEIPRLEQQVEASPDAVAPRVRLGAAYRADGRLEDARRVLRQARSIDPDHPRAALFLGLTLEDMERWEDAREVYERYLAGAGDSELGERIESRLALLDRRQLQASIRRSLERERELADRTPAENSVAVFPYLYRGTSPRFQPLSRALAEFLVTDLGRSDRITVLERTRVQLLLDEMELSETRYVDPSTAVRSGRLLGTSRVVQGVMSGDERSLQVETSMVDARGEPTDEPPAPIFSGERSAEDILDLQAQIAFSVFEEMGVTLTPAERRAIEERPTDNLDALLAFGHGLIAQDSANFADAARHFRQAAELDPDFQQAGQRAETASDLSAAAGQSTDELAQEAFAGDEAVATTELAEPAEITEDLTGPEDVGLARDPVAEVLGVEGVSESTAILRILIPRPGGLR